MATSMCQMCTLTRVILRKDIVCSGLIKNTRFLSNKTSKGAGDTPTDVGKKHNSSADGTKDSAKTGGPSEEGYVDIQAVKGLLSQSGLKRAFEMFDRVEKSTAKDLSSNKTKNNDFASLLRNSKLMQLGDPSGRIVVGTIIEALEDDLYIDFGGKFHCVCKRPRENSRLYKRGVEVKIRLKDLELSSRFLGANKDLTLLEADATLVGLNRQQATSPSKQ